MTTQEYLTSTQTLEELCRMKPKRVVHDAIKDIKFSATMTVLGGALGAFSAYSVLTTLGGVSRFADAAQNLNRALYAPTLIAGYAAEIALAVFAVEGSIAASIGLTELFRDAKSLITGRGKSDYPASVFALRGGRYIQAPSRSDLSFGVEVEPVDDVSQLGKLSYLDFFLMNGFVLTDVASKENRLTVLKGCLWGRQLVFAAAHEPGFAEHVSAKLSGRPDGAPLYIAGTLTGNKNGEGVNYFILHECGDAFTLRRESVA